MEGIDLAGVVDSDFQGIQINFALPRPAGFANFCGAGQDLFLLRGWAGRGSPFSAGRGGAHIPDVYLPKSIPLTKFTIAKKDFFSVAPVLDMTRHALKVHWLPMSIILLCTKNHYDATIIHF